MTNEEEHLPGMSFVLGLVLFIVVIGILDARLPWPSVVTKAVKA